MFKDNPLIQKQILWRLDYVDGYATKPITVVIAGPEMYRDDDLNRIKALLIDRLDAAYQKLKKEIEEA